MIRIALTSALLAGVALPAYALDAPVPSAADKRLRTVIHDPQQVVPFFTAVGATARIQLGAGEEVVGVLVSDQTAMAAEPEPDDTMVADTARPSGGGAPGPTSCDRNICRSVYNNFVYIRPLRDLAPQPVFIQTKHCDETGKCEQVPYALQLVTRPGDMTEATANTYYGLAYTYPAREAAARRRAAAAQAAKWQAQRAQQAERQAMAPLPVSYSTQNNAWQYAWQSEPSAYALMPDEVWDDGRSTFLRFNGMRRVPNVYTRNPDRTKTLVTAASEPGPTGTVLRIGRTAKMFVLEDGALIGAIHNAGPDPEGRSSLTVAAPSPPMLRVGSAARPSR